MNITFIKTVNKLNALNMITVFRTVISYTRSLDPTRPVTFVANAQYSEDVAVSKYNLIIIYED